MKLLLYIFVFSTLICESQEKYFGKVCAEFHGGRLGLQSYIDSNFVYPEINKEDRFTDGTVFVQMNINKEGKITDWKLSESCRNEKIDSSVLYMISKMPNWLPALNNGVPIDCVFVFPFVIVRGVKQYLEGNSTSKISKAKLTSYFKKRNKELITGQEFFDPVNCDKFPSTIGGESVIDDYIDKFSKRKTSGLNSDGAKTYIQYVIDTNGFVSSTKIILSGGEKMDSLTVNYYKYLPQQNAAIKNGKKIPFATTGYYQMFTEREGSFNEKKLDDMEAKAFDDYWYNKGVVMMEKNYLSKALYNFENSLFYNSNDIDAMYNIGAIYLKMKRTEQACEYWNKIKKLGKNDADQLIEKHCSGITSAKQLPLVDTSEAYVIVEEMPGYPGGNSNLMKYLQENIKIPNGTKGGKVFMRFVISANGSLGDITVAKSSGDMKLDEEAIRVIKMMPNWIPGKQNGKTVPTYFNLPINFKL